MKHIGFLKGAIILLSLGVLATFSSCSDADHGCDSSQEISSTIIMSDSEKEQTKVGQGAENSGLSEENQPALTSPPQTQELQEPQEDFYAQYLGKTVGDAVRGLGNEYIVNYYEGSTMIGYPGNIRLYMSWQDL